MNRAFYTGLAAAQCAALLTTAPAQTPILPAAPLGDDPAIPTTAYEAPPVLKASEIWEGNLLSGPYHRVREEIDTTNFINTYTIDSEFGIFYAHGDHMLLERVREIYAIAGIRETKETDAYAKAVGSNAVGSLKGAGNLIKNPAGAIKGIGQGAGRFLRSAAERMKTTSEGNVAANELKQYTEAKRQIAGEYKVNPYTSNTVYQDEVDGVAAASAAGSLTFKLASLAIPGGAGIALRSLGLSEDLNEMLVRSGPYDLRVQNRARLRKMALLDKDIEAFLDHPYLTPRHRTAIAIALEKLENTRYRGDYIRLALTARSEEEAFLYSNNATILALYHQNRSRLFAIVECNGFPAACTVDNRLVMPMLLDYGSWTEVGDRFTQSFAAYERDDLTITSRELVISGVLSPLALEETLARGIIVTQQALGTLAR